MTDNIILPEESTETPAYDFGSGELADKVKELKDQLGMIEESQEELTPEALAARAETIASTDDFIKGSDINWEDYELDPRFAHFYPRAEFRNTPQGPRWLVKVMEFVSDSKQYTAKGFTKKQEPMGLGDYLTYMVNGSERWQIGSITPNGAGFAGIVMQRQVTVTLPDPVAIVKETTVAPITDEELIATEDASLEWAGLKEETSGQPDLNGEVSTEQPV